MPLTLTEHRDRDGRITGYTATGGSTELKEQLMALTIALEALTPTSTTIRRHPEGRSARAQLALQLVAMLDICKDARSRERAIEALHGIHRYLLSQFSVGAEEPAAQQQVTPGVAYFEFDWANLFKDGEPQSRG